MQDYEGEKLYRAYLTAFKELHCANGFFYDLSSNLVYFPKANPDVSDIFEYVHEECHSQFGNTLLGLTIQTLAELLASIEKHLFTSLRPLLDTTKSDSTLFFNLFVFGHPRTAQPSEAVAEALLTRFRDMRLGQVGSLIESFQAIRRRYDALIRKWRPLHEGLAVYATMNIVTAVRDEEARVLKEALARLAAHFPMPASEREIIKRLREIGRQEQERWSKGIGCQKEYREVVNIARRIEEMHKGGLSVWVAALAASHFPYNCCDLLDMPDEAFANWLDDGPFAFVDRFKKAAECKHALAEVADEFQRGIFNSASATNLLGEISSPLALSPLPEACRRFGTWEKMALWKSKVFDRFLTAINTSYDAVAPQNFLAEFDYDRVDDFRILERWIPPLVTISGDVFTDSPRQRNLAIRRFINTYETYRTGRLVDWLEGLEQ